MSAKHNFQIKLFSTLFIACCFAVASPAQEQTEVKQLTFNVTVKHPDGAFAAGLKAENFSIEGNEEKKAISFFHAGNEPASIGILFDTSSSMRNQQSDKNMRMNMLREGLLRFVNNGNETNEYFFISFDEKPRLLLDLTQDHNAFFQTLKNLDSVKLKGNTDFYSALLLAGEKIILAKFPKRVLIIVSDGQENLFNRKFIEVKENLKRVNALVYSVALFEAEFPENSLIPTKLDEITEITGGKSFYTYDFSGVKTVFNLIADELRNQYRISFHVRGNSVGKGGQDEWHKLKIKIKIPKDASRKMQKFAVRTCEGYYSSSINVH